jgi:uncharacterized protein (DUF58 family)
MAITQQDSAGLVCLGDRVEEQIPARQGKMHLNMIYQHLENPRGEGGGNFGEVLRQATPELGKRGMVMVLTDGVDELGPFLDALKGLCVREHDVTLFQVLDRDELEFPFDKMTEFRHPETARKVVGDPASLRAKYLERLEAHLEEIEDFCKRWRIDYLRLHNGEDLTKLLTTHFLRRLMYRTP